MIVRRVEIRHLRYFVAVAEELHFNRAAERLHVAQPALSLRIKALEQELGLTLFERTTHRVELTSEGEILLDRAREALQVFDTFRVAGQQLRQGAYGKLYVGSAHQVRQLASNVMRELQQRSPNLQVVSREQGTSEILDAVANGEIDVGIGLCTERRDGIVYRSLRDDELLLVVPESHQLSDQASANWSLLQDECVLLPSDTLARGSNKAILNHFAEAGIVPCVSYGNSDHDQESQSVVAGEGVEFRTADYMSNHGKHRVRILHLEPVTTLPVEIFWRGDHNTPHIAHFVEIASEFCSRQQNSERIVVGQTG
jgi:DNA-binding transcriptional LysR family regulator